MPTKLRFRSMQSCRDEGSLDWRRGDVRALGRRWAKTSCKVCGRAINSRQPRQIGAQPLSRSIVSSELLPKPSPYFSHAVKGAGLVFVSGTAPYSPETGKIVGETIQEQT